MDTLVVYKRAVEHVLDTHPLSSAKAAFHSTSKCQHEKQRAGVFVCA